MPFPVPLFLTNPGAHSWQTGWRDDRPNSNNCAIDQIVIYWACTERSFESILKSRLRFQTKLTSTQSNSHYNLKYYCELIFFSVYCTYFIFLLFSIIFLGVGKIGGPWTGSMDPPGPYFHGPGPWTGSMEGVHGPGVHVLYFPAFLSTLNLRSRLFPPMSCDSTLQILRNSNTQP